jgi:hypothetical protein
MEKMKRDEEWALRTIPLQLLWFALTFGLALYFKGPFIVSDVTRWIYICVWIAIYLSGSFYFGRRK